MGADNEDRRRASYQETTAAATSEPVNRADQGKFSIPARTMADGIAPLVQGYPIMLLDGQRHVLVPESAIPSLVQGGTQARVGIPCVTDMLLDRYGASMTTNDVAEVLHRHPSHIRALCQSKELPAVRIGDRWHIPTAKLAVLLEGGE